MMHRGLLFFRLMLLTASGLGLLGAELAYARHGEAPTATSSIGLANRIPEPAPYVVSETTANTSLGLPAGDFPPPPYENLWTGINDTGGCSGCHTGLYDQWNGAMMSNAWRDPGWRGAFLLVARLTSTDGCRDVKDAVTAFGGRAPDGSQAYDCSTDPVTGKLRSLNPFANANDTSTFNVIPGTTTPFPGVVAANYSGSGSLMDDFCSRCHMPTNYVDATIAVSNDPPSGQEHGHISPTYDPTSVNPTAPITTRDPFTGGLVRESFAERLDGNRAVNSNSGKIGIVCEVCHTNVESRFTPYHNYTKSGTEYFPATKNAPRWDGAVQGLAANQQDMLTVPNAASPNLGYALGAGAFRLSPHALHLPERFGPLTWNDFTGTIDTYVSQVFAGARFTTVGLPTTDGKLITVTGANTATSTPLFYSKANAPGKHDTFYQVKFERAEFCASCHDVTNPATIKNAAGKWVGGFPIERTYTEYLNSRYADRPGNVYFDANFRRDCQTCHMQQSFGQPGTGLTLFAATTNPVTGGPVTPLSPLAEPSCDRVLHHPGYSHHFVGGNAYITKMIGADTDGGGTVSPYPELLETSFTSTNKNSRYNSARFDTTPSRSGPAQTQHERFAWDRLRNVLVIGLTTPATVARPATEALAALTITIRNEGSGHNYPTGFPEGRNSWVAVRAVDTRNTAVITDDVELMIQDSAFANRRSAGVGNLTAVSMTDPNFPGCNWIIPEGSPDPHSRQFRAVATLDALCPTLDLPYATPVNLTVNADGLPTDAGGRVIDRNNPTGLPRYTDLDNDGDFFDDSFLIDTRLGPPRKGVVGTVKDVALANLGSRYSIVIPSTVVGPISVTTAVYYQSFEAIVAKKFLGNLANTDDLDANEGLPGGAPTLEPCVLKSACDRTGQPLGSAKDNELRAALRFDPVVVEGAPPVPAEVLTRVIQVTGTLDNVAPRVVINNSKTSPNTTAAIPANRHWSPSPFGGAAGNFSVEGIGEQNVNPGRIVKITFSEPVTGVDANTFYLTDSKDRSIPALLDQIDDTTWALFPFTSSDKTFLAASINILHVAPSRAGSTIRDAAGNPLAPGPAAGSEHTFGFKIM